MAVKAEIKDNLPGFLRALEAMTRKAVYVGIPADHDHRPDGPLGNAAIGYIHEHGAPEINLPARPWLVPGVKNGEDVITKRMQRLAKATLRIKGASAIQVVNGLEGVGLAAVSAVKNYLTNGEFATLQPSTIRNRRRRSKGSTYRRKATGSQDVQPLIDTGELRNSVTSVVR